jgi:hypothetical protein
LPHFGAARQDDAAIDAAAFFGVPVGMVGAGHHFAHGFGQGLALVQRHVAADLLGALAGQRADLAQDFGAQHGRAVAPGFEGALGRGQCTVEVGGGGVGQLAEHFQRGRVGYRLGLAPVAGQELTVYI